MIFWLFLGALVLGAGKSGKRQVLGAGRLIVAHTAPKEAAFVGEPIPPPTVSVENEWVPVWLKKGKWVTLRWGFCLWDLMKEQTEAELYQEGDFVKWLAGLIGKAVAWVINAVKMATVDISLCVRMEIPAGHIELFDGSTFWLPSEPEGGLPGDIPGWNPGTTRLGFHATIADWPLGDEGPPGNIGALWIKNLGDLWGWGARGRPVTVYHVIMSQGGVIKSFPAMSKQDWRTALILGGKTPEGGDIYPGGIVKWFKDWRFHTQEWHLYWTTRRKAMRDFD